MSCAASLEGWALEAGRFGRGCWPGCWGEGGPRREVLAGEAGRWRGRARGRCGAWAARGPGGGAPWALGPRRPRRDPWVGWLAGTHSPAPAGPCALPPLSALGLGAPQGAGRCVGLALVPGPRDLSGAAWASRASRASRHPCPRGVSVGVQCGCSCVRCRAHACAWRGCLALHGAGVCLRVDGSVPARLMAPLWDGVLCAGSWGCPCLRGTRRWSPRGPGGLASGLTQVPGSRRPGPRGPGERWGCCLWVLSGPCTSFAGPPPGRASRKALWLLCSGDSGRWTP